MEAIRQIVTVNEIILEMQLPEPFRNKQVEVIVLPTDEDSNFGANKSYDYSSFYGRAAFGLTLYQIDEKFKHMRDKWDRLPD